MLCFVLVEIILEARDRMEKSLALDREREPDSESFSIPVDLSTIVQLFQWT